MRLVFNLILALLFIQGERASAQETLSVYESRDPTYQKRDTYEETTANFVDAFGLGIKAVPLLAAIRKKAWIRDYINHRLKADLISFLQSKEWQGLKESSIRRWDALDAVSSDQLIDDIQNSPYVLSRTCHDDVEKKQASTGWTRNDSVCFGVRSILRGQEGWNYAEMKAKLVGLGLHESLHHFGFADSDNRLFVQFYDRYLYYLQYQLTAPTEVPVSPEFKSIRTKFRLADFSKIESDQLEMHCELVSSGQEFSETVRAIFSSRLKLERSILNSQQFEINFDDSAKVNAVWPDTLVRFDTAETREWIMRAKNQEVSFVLRKGEQGHYFIEISNALRKVKIPAIASLGYVLGYAECIAN